MATPDPSSDYTTSLPAYEPERWHLGPLPPSVSLFVAAALAGVVAGVLAFALKWTIAHLSVAVTGYVSAPGPGWILYPVALLGIILAVMFQRYVARRPLSHGSDRLGRMVAEGDFRVPGVFAWGPLAASALTLGFGGSAGAEGPIATSGGAVASLLSRRLGMPPRLVGIMIGCGAGAGIAGIFKAPIGGMLFTIEVMGMELATVPLLALVISCLVSGMTAYALSGFTLDVPLEKLVTFDPALSGWMLVLGVFCGLYSCYYIWMARRLRGLFDRIGQPWANAVLSGSILGVALVLFPVLYGEGYGAMASVIDGDMTPLVSRSVWPGVSTAPSPAVVALICLGVALLKPVACIATNSGGGVAGDFAPTLFAGCMAGLGLSCGLNHLLGLSLPADVLALCGMAGVMAGVISAPLMSIFIVVEMTGCIGMTFPVMLAGLTSYAVMLTARALSRSAKLRKRCR
ncbi:MAG: chloride channel protein [Duncaniella sp.]|nr:chloride channel protein [Duncaniella sp.]